jgi:hypothetical protein
MPSQGCGGFFYVQKQIRKDECLIASHARTKISPQEDVYVQEFVDMISPSVIKFNTGHFICGNTFRCVWALRKYLTW